MTLIESLKQNLEEFHKLLNEPPFPPIPRKPLPGSGEDEEHDDLAWTRKLHITEPSLQNKTPLAF